jgi:hypothetical protein
MITFIDESGYRRKRITERPHMVRNLVAARPELLFCNAASNWNTLSAASPIEYLGNYSEQHALFDIYPKDYWQPRQVSGSNPEEGAPARAHHGLLVEGRYG